MKISVCIPTYNQGRYIIQSIESVLNQTVLPFEVIISNDCSTDNTKEILDELAHEHKILKVIHQPTNIGMVSNTNECLKMASGKFIVKLDSDDYLLPKYIETLFTLINKYPNAGYAHSSIQEINAQGEYKHIRRLFRKTGFVDSEYALKSSIKGYKVAANIIMFRKEALEKVNYITSNVNFAEDYYLSVEIAAAGFGNVYSEEVLACYRVWNDSNNVRQKRKLDEINGLRIIFDKVIKPAFVSKRWNETDINKAKTNFAKRHVSSLGWTIYSQAEKNELETAILELSETHETRIYVWLYKNNYGKIIQTYEDLRSAFIHRTKNFLLSMFSHNQVK